MDNELFLLQLPYALLLLVPSQKSFHELVQQDVDDKDNELEDKKPQITFMPLLVRQRLVQILDMEHLPLQMML